MQRSITTAKNVYRNVPCDVFINHRGIDTKKNIVGLLYDHLVRVNIRPFLDSKNMKPGDKLSEKIDNAITGCKVGIVVFSPRYCESYFCLDELARLTEAKKKVIPIFCEVKPSELTVKYHLKYSKHELDRFKWALDEAKYTVGLTFNSLNGDWPGFLMTATEGIIQNIIEVEEQHQE